MSGTGTPDDPPAASPLETDDSAADHAFFRALEERFLALRGRATLLSPEDWQVARRWRRESVPLDLIVRVMTDLVARRAGKRGRRISSLRYFAPAVEAAHDEWRELTAGGVRREPEPTMSIEERLARLAAGLPDSTPRRAALAGEIAALAFGDAEEVEARLSELDDRVRSEAYAALAPARRETLEEHLESALVRLKGHLGDAEIADARDRLRAQFLRRELGLPFLSLFALEITPGSSQEE